MAIVKYVRHRWNYMGDVSLEYGGYFWQEDGQDDYVNAVRVTPVSDAGGPDNVFAIETGSIYIPVDEPDRIRAALNCCGVVRPGDSLKKLVDNGREITGRAARHCLIYCCQAYGFFDENGTTAVRIGPPDESYRGHGWNPQPDKVLRYGSDLRNYVKKEFLR